MAVKRDEYFLLLEGETSGPFTLEELHQMWQDEKITLDTLYVRPGMKGCKPVNLILNQVIGYRKPAATEELKPRAEPEIEFELEETSNLGGVYVLAAIGVGFLIWLLTAVSKPPPDPSLRLNADVEVSLTHLTVFNRNNYAWLETMVVINGQPPGGYRYKITALVPNGSAIISLPDFADGAGNRFAPWGMRVETVWIGDDKQGYHPFPLSASEGSDVPPPPLR